MGVNGYTRVGIASYIYLRARRNRKQLLALLCRDAHHAVDPEH